MTDRELLEMAAKAAGIPELRGAASKFHCYYIAGDEQVVKWNPLTDDGDALRLAVKLQLTPHIDGNMTDCEGCTEVSLNDPYAATRRAIVRAAAEIGKVMP